MLAPRAGRRAVVSSNAFEAELVGNVQSKTSGEFTDSQSFFRLLSCTAQELRAGRYGGIACEARRLGVRSDVGSRNVGGGG